MKKFLIVIVMLLLCPVPSALADGIILPPIPPYHPIEENEQIAAINYQDGLQKMIIAVNFNMKNISQAVWIFPVPAKPERVAIDVVESFPYLYGSEIVEGAKYSVDPIIKATTITQLYPLIYFWFLEGIEPIYYLTEPLMALAAYGKGYVEVTVHERLEKGGITTEVITAETGDALYNYLQGKGLNLTKGSIPVLDSYIGMEYTFVVSWVSSKEEGEKFYCREEQRNVEVCYTLYSPVCGSDGITYPNDCMACRNPSVEWYTMGECEYPHKPYYSRQPGIFITFPTDKIYYPLLPTSVYGSKKIPIRIYLLDFVTPEIFSEIKSYTTVNYYTQEYYGYPRKVYESIPDFERYHSLKDFYGNVEVKGYTKVEINAPSKYFTQDLWFKDRAPAKVSYANLIYSSFSEHPLISGIALVLLISALTGAVTGLLVFREAKRFAIIGLTNIFSIIGLAIAIAFTRTRKIDESIKKRLRKEGLIAITVDKRKIVFIILFSIFFLILAALIGFLIKLPLM